MTLASSVAPAPRVGVLSHPWVRFGIRRLGRLLVSLWVLVTTFVSGLAIAALFLRMAALLAARNLFAAFVAVLSVTGATATLAAVLFVQWRITTVGPLHLAELHFAVLMALGFFVSLSLLSLRPYFSIQASRFLSATVFFPCRSTLLMSCVTSGF